MRRRAETAASTDTPKRCSKPLCCQILRVIRRTREADGPSGGGRGLEEAGTAPALGSGFRSHHGERIKLPDGGSRQRELAKPSETKILFLCKCPLEIKLRGKEQKPGGDVSGFVSVFFYSPNFPGGVSGWLRQMFADQIC